jgi:peptidoglycan/LPS O-acetylase OafA/YrhL
MMMLLDEQTNRAVIDGMRAIGIVLVICFHVTIGLATLLEADSMQGYVDTLPSVINIMWQALGSEIIFLFSGFLLSYLLMRELLRSGGIDVRDFYIRRLSRIIPLYLIALALYSLVRDFGALEFLLNLLFVSQIFDATTIVPVGWSLEVLVQSYLLLPFVVLLFLRSNHPIKLCVAAIAAFLAIRYAVFAADPPSYTTPIHALFAGTDTTEVQDKTYYLLVYRATPFLLGFLIAFLVVHKDALLRSIFDRRGMAPTLLLVSLLTTVGSGFLPVQDSRSWLYVWSSDQFWLWFWTLQRFIFSVGIGLFALCAWYGKSRLIEPLLRVSQWRVWAHISHNIYSIYLFHPVFLLPAAALAFRTIEKEQLLPVHLLEVFATIVLATIFSTLFGGVVTRFVELPAQGWIRKKFSR